MKKIKYLFPVLGVIVLTAHFTLVLLSVVPFNPITFKKNDLIYAYVDPLFTQTWTLFAPDPIHTNDALQIQLEFENGNISDWIDATYPIVDKMHDNYISPYNRMGRISQSITHQMWTEDPLIHDLRKSVEEKNKLDTIELLDTNFEKNTKTYSDFLLRYASAFVKSAYPNEKVKFLSLRIVKQESIPFSDKDSRLENEWTVVHEIKKQPFIHEISPLL